MRTRMLVMGVLLSVGWAGPARAAACLYGDPMDPGSGKLMKWPSSAMPIKYLINASKVAPADKDAFINAVKAAFAAYEAVPCSLLKFTYGGESPSVDSASLNAILVIFTDAAKDAYFYQAKSSPPDSSIITDALIQMNIKDYTYVVGAQANAIDVQTAVTQMLPGALGFYVGNDPATGGLSEIKFNYVNTTLTKEQTDGVQYLYFKADPGCTQPTAPSLCPSHTQPGGDGGTNVGDGGSVTTGDGGSVTHGDGTKPTSGDAKTSGSGDAGVLPPPPADDGCCRVGHTSDEAGRGLLALAGLALVLALRRRRRA